MACIELAKQIISDLTPGSYSTERIIKKTSAGTRQPSEDTTGSDIKEYTPQRLHVFWRI